MPNEARAFCLYVGRFQSRPLLVSLCVLARFTRLGMVFAKRALGEVKSTETKKKALVTSAFGLCGALMSCAEEEEVV